MQDLAAFDKLVHDFVDGHLLIAENVKPRKITPKSKQEEIQMSNNTTTETRRESYEAITTETSKRGVLILDVLGNKQMTVDDTGADSFWFAFYSYKAGLRVSARPSSESEEEANRIVELMGDLPRIELFARSAADGWDCWGNSPPPWVPQGVLSFRRASSLRIAQPPPQSILCRCTTTADRHK